MTAAEVSIAHCCSTAGVREADASPLGFQGFLLGVRPL